MDSLSGGEKCGGQGPTGFDVKRPLERVLQVGQVADEKSTLLLTGESQSMASDFDLCGVEQNQRDIGFLRRGGVGQRQGGVSSRGLIASNQG